MQHAHKTTDLAPAERVALERLLGRELRSDEAVEVVAHQPAELPATQEAERRGVAARIRELAKGKHLAGATVRDLIGVETDAGRRA